MASESLPGREAGIVIPFEALELNPAIAETLRQLQQAYGRELKAHVPQE